MANIIDGKALSLRIKNELKQKIESFKQEFNRDIILAVVLVGNNSASEIYVRNKLKATEYVGIKSLSFCLPMDSTQEEVEECVKSLADDDSVDGIIVQLPLPKTLNEEKVLKIIPDGKDVDGFSCGNIGKLFMNKPSTVSCTPLGVMKMFENEKISLTGKNAVVLGRSNIVGKPMASLLLNANCTVTICHSKTEGLKDICKKADILVAGIGKPKYVTEDMVKKGAVVIDVGINRTENGIVGDVDFENVKNKASYITPVPGGVGPMTIAMLMYNTYNCALRRENAKRL